MSAQVGAPTAAPAEQLLEAGELQLEGGELPGLQLDAGEILRFLSTLPLPEIQK